MSLIALKIKGILIYHTVKKKILQYTEMVLQWTERLRLFTMGISWYYGTMVIETLLL